MLFLSLSKFTDGLEHLLTQGRLLWARQLGFPVGCQPGPADWSFPQWSFPSLKRLIWTQVCVWGREGRASYLSGWSPTHHTSKICCFTIQNCSMKTVSCLQNSFLAVCQLHIPWGKIAFRLECLFSLHIIPPKSQYRWNEWVNEWHINLVLYNTDLGTLHLHTHYIILY